MDMKLLVYKVPRQCSQLEQPIDISDDDEAAAEIVCERISLLQCLQQLHV